MAIAAWLPHLWSLLRVVSVDICASSGHAPRWRHAPLHLARPAAKTPANKACTVPVDNQLELREPFVRTRNRAKLRSGSGGARDNARKEGASIGDPAHLLTIAYRLCSLRFCCRRRAATAANTSHPPGQLLGFAARFDFHGVCTITTDHSSLLIFSHSLPRHHWHPAVSESKTIRIPFLFICGWFRFWIPIRANAWPKWPFQTFCFICTIRRSDSFPCPGLTTRTKSAFLTFRALSQNLYVQ
jgi:hypothetical protein